MFKIITLLTEAFILFDLRFADKQLVNRWRHTARWFNDAACFRSKATVARTKCVSCKSCKQNKQRVKLIFLSILADVTVFSHMN